jgi:hypothetical protein
MLKNTQIEKKYIKESKTDIKKEIILFKNILTNIMNEDEERMNKEKINKEKEYIVERLE